ncbi:MAG TPA: ribosome small subunit-dependent GTPase A [Candidatus Dormibacteraeota bacterium]|nr:ribosome small subunit-dependent GTPase A [Candidatus Dormibacteraeota bacterium]
MRQSKHHTLRDAGPAEPGVVVSRGRNRAWVAAESDGRLLLCDYPSLAELPVVGDSVLVRPSPGAEGEGIIVEIRPRQRAIARITGSGERKIMAANVDVLVIVAALARPDLRYGFVDRCLAFAEHQGIAPLVALTKADLAAPEVIDAALALYRERLGYDVVVLSVVDHRGIPELAEHVAGHRALMLGQSGVGKSSLFRALGADRGARVGEVNERTGRGRQTTTSARLAYLGHGFLIDTPGVREFSLADLDPGELAACFRDLAPYLGRCRFPDCRHLVEPDCAVRAAVAAGDVAPLRYASYRKAVEQSTGTLWSD